MSAEQIIVTILVALISAGATLGVERARVKREANKEISGATATVETARIADEASKRKEVDEAARDIRDFLRNQVAELGKAIDEIETSRAAERERWHQMLGDLSTQKLELELQHKRDKALMDQMLEEAKAIDAEIRTLRTRVAQYQVDATIMSARLDACQLECERLRLRKKGEN